jgi:hypothetical protein
MEWDERDDWDDYWEEREFNTFSRVKMHAQHKSLMVSSLLLNTMSITSMAKELSRNSLILRILFFTLFEMC